MLLWCITTHSFLMLNSFCLVFYFLICFFLQADPTLEKNFKGHKDTVTSVDISSTMKQIGKWLFIYHLPHNVIHLFVVAFYYIPFAQINVSDLVQCVLFTCAFFPLSHRLHGRKCHDLEHETSDACLSFWWTQRCCPFRSVFSLRQPGGLSLQRQDCPSLGSNNVSLTGALFHNAITTSPFSLSLFWKCWFCACICAGRQSQQFSGLTPRRCAVSTFPAMDKIY